ncbi:MAG: hypothetical protein F6J95_008150 [Leptolyngbya sp. SIO1E4]|nr:hypothetical protein [Leptolyngbya sp. SIO1E4]
MLDPNAHRYIFHKVTHGCRLPVVNTGKRQQLSAMQAIRIALTDQSLFHPS